MFLGGGIETGGCQGARFELPFGTFGIYWRWWMHRVYSLGEDDGMEDDCTRCALHTWLDMPRLVGSWGGLIGFEYVVCNFLLFDTSRMVNDVLPSCRPAPFFTSEIAKPESLIISHRRHSPVPLPLHPATVRAVRKHPVFLFSYNSSAAALLCANDEPAFSIREIET